MSNRRKYDHYGIEIQRWNRDNIVEKIDCDCGQLAKKVRGKHEVFECAECGRVYHRVLGNYVAMIDT
ncbi:hypothetical protein [Enterococcus faecalis]|uniref:Transcriptional regulator, UvrC family n=1 Tax=Enterococcus faecalis TaxID=1351 RepID=A0A1W6QWT7_ENTFL|nr:hypothetical protein [Enterococcus faecalis]ARO45604.1 hypothetical protein [Enterococcus faecalis]RBR39514.1 UvrC family transcriptional regulator [Enterococcus faecalis]